MMCYLRFATAFKRGEILLLLAFSVCVKRTLVGQEMECFKGEECEGDVFCGGPEKGGRLRGKDCWGVSGDLKW